MMLRSLTCFLLVLLSSTALQAQFSSTVKVLKREHIVGEPVIIRVTLTNYTGREQILQGSRVPWISFIVTSSNGNPITARRGATPGAVKIAAGQTLARDFDISRQFQLNQPGNYTVSAVVRPNTNKIEGTTTNRTHFQLSTGRPYWTQKVGNVGPKGSTREFRLLQFRGDRATQFFVQIKDEDSGHIVRTTPLGDVLMMRKPSITIDGQRHLNVLFLTTPNTYLHYRISPTGEVLTRDMHRRTLRGEPKLSIVDRGAVIVTNSVLFDPVAEAKKRAAIRKITDRPAGFN